LSPGADNKYRVERGDPVADRDRILRLWEHCGFESGGGAAARYDWFYLDNPCGRGRVYLLFCGDELVGALGAGSRQMARGPAEPMLRAAILVDFVVDPAHRSMFPALQLQRVAREHELCDAQVVYGLPDVKAAPVFRRLGSAAQLASGSHVRVLRSEGFMRRKLPRITAPALRLLCWVVDRARLVAPWTLCRLRGLRSEWRQDFPEGIEEFWRRAGTLANLATGVRHREFLEWRFRQTAEHPWMVLSVTDRRGRLEAYFVCRREGVDLHVFDMLLADRRTRAASLLALSLAAWNSGATSVRVVFGGCERMQRTLFRSGFLLREQRPCFVIQPPDADAGLLPREWWLTRADEDV
jgi:hypothetical protein